MFSSVRFRTTIFYSLTIFLALSIFSIFLYSKLKNAIYEYIDEILFLKAESIADNIEEIINLHKDDRLNKNCLDIIMCSLKIKKLIENVINSHINDPHLNSISVRVLNARGEILLSSLNMPDVDFINENIEEVILGKAYYTTVSLKIDGQYIDWRIYSTPVKTENHGIYVIEVLRPFTQSAFTLSAVKRYIYIFVPLVVFITGFLGMIVVRITLKPLDNLTQAISKIISEGDLKLRVKLPTIKDEIWRVADLFNTMMERLEKMFLLQKNFIYDVSHSLKTPLTIMKGEIDIVLKKERSVSEYITTLQSISEEVERLINLVEDFLMIAKIDNFENKYLAATLDLKDIVIDAVKNVKKFADIKNIKINLDTIDDAIKVRADRAILVKAISNIIENAIKYSPNNSDVFVSITKKNTKAIIEVKDNGIGIPQESIKKVFEKFYRAPNVEYENGFGLGLSIARSAVESCGGIIEIDSVEGKGTKVKICLNIV